MATQSNRGRFSDRLKKMRRNRLKRKKNATQIEDNEKMYINFMKVVAAIPVMVYDNVFDKATIQSSKSIQVTDNVNNCDFDSVVVKNNSIKSNRDTIVERRIKNRQKVSVIDVSSIKKKQDIFFKKDQLNVRNGIENEKKTADEDAKKLEKKIINLIKKDLIKTVNELEILESELYILSEVNGDDKTLIECRRNIDEIKKILCKIDILKKKYDFLKDNYDFEYLLELDNNELIDNIIELRNMFDSNRVKAMTEDYKLLDVYKFLYLRIDQIHEDTEKFEIEKKNKEEELKNRDIDFDKLKDDVYNIQKMNASYDLFVKEQNKLLKNLDDEVSKIDSHEVFNYRLKGFERYLFNSFKYLGLIMMSPLRGVVPGIATQTLITKNVVNNLYRNLEWEENRRMVYDAVDYSSTIIQAINDLDSTDRVVDATLEDLVKLKMQYNDRFRKYQGDFLEYEEVIKKINDMENKILGNKIKIEIMKSRMQEKERENENKLKLVRKLNEDANKNIVSN